MDTVDRLRVPSPIHGHLDLDLDVLTLNPGDLRVVYTASQPLLDLRPVHHLLVLR